MNLSFYIARRYLFSKKSHNAINIISAISVCGVTLASLALICTLSVFNGFHELVKGLFTNFDPELKIEAAEGKVFDSSDSIWSKLRAMPQIEVFTETLEDNAMVQYEGRQAMVTIKGVGDNFQKLTTIDEILLGEGSFRLYDAVVDYGVMGVQLVYVLNSGLAFSQPLEVFAPKRGTKINLANPTANFTKQLLYSPGVVFRVNQEKYDGSYILTSLDFARRLFNYTTEVSAIELKLAQGVKSASFKKELQRLLGNKYVVKDLYEQQEEVFHIVEIEKFISYLFLCFILVIACFNIISTLSMLMLDKEKDVKTLRNMGASDALIVRIFVYEGNLISFMGAFAGLLLGVVLCLLQQHYGFIPLGEPGYFVVDSYPVQVYFKDVVLVFCTVVLVGSLLVWLPVRLLSRRFLSFSS